MGQDVDQALNDLAATRASLERDIDELFARLPEPAVMAQKAKTYGAAAGGAAVTVGLVALRARKASELKARRHRGAHQRRGAGARLLAPPAGRAVRAAAGPDCSPCSPRWSWWP